MMLYTVQPRWTLRDLHEVPRQGQAYGRLSQFVPSLIPALNEMETMEGVLKMQRDFSTKVHGSCYNTVEPLSKDTPGIRTPL